jgi:hypothetical protein
MNKIITLFLIALMFIAVGCIPQKKSSDRKASQQTEQLMKEVDSKVGFPAIKNGTEKRLAKMILELRDQADLMTHTYLVSMTGKLIYLGKSIGYGLPYSVQYVSPTKIIRPCTGTYISVPQAEPSGLFVPDGLSATWVMLINPETGSPAPTYVEQEIMVSQFRLH